MQHWFKGTALGGLMLLSSTTAFGQNSIGTLEYGPLAAQAVPIPLPIVAGIGCLLVLVAWRFMRSNRGRSLAANIVSSMMLGALGVALMIWQTVYVPVTDAAVAVSLDNPNGGIISFRDTFDLFENTSGVPLQIKAVNVDSNCTSSNPQNECTVGLVLNLDDVCALQFSCSVP